LVSSTVKTKTKTEKVDIVRATDFFNKLFELEIIKTNKIHQNLAGFLCIDETYISSLMYKKIKRAVNDFYYSEAL